MTRLNTGLQFLESLAVTSLAYKGRLFLGSGFDPFKKIDFTEQMAD
jgi:hypothetical protein